MPDPSAQIQRLYIEGFDIETFERYSNAIGILRDGCIALFQATPAGLQMVGVPGWRMGEVLGVLTEKDGRQVFQSKSEVLDATPERLATLQRFRDDLQRLLGTPH